MDRKKIMVIGLLAVALAVSGYAAYDKFIKVKPVSVSLLKGNPESYLGDVVIAGKAGQVASGQGLFEIRDDKGCCNMVLAVPTTPEQKTQLGYDALYQGTLPAEGQAIEVDAKLTKDSKGFVLEVIEVRSASGGLLLKKV